MRHSAARTRCSYLSFFASFVDGVLLLLNHICCKSVNLDGGLITMGHHARLHHSTVGHARMGVSPTPLFILGGQHGCPSREDGP